MSREEIKCVSTISSEQTESRVITSVGGKFKAYRLSVESVTTKLKEAETVIEELKNEIDFSRDVEKNLRSQISSSQNRLISLQNTLKKFINISDQQLQNEKVSQRMDKKIQELEEGINEIREKLQNLLQCTVREVDLLKKIKVLESQLERKNSECDLMKMEVQTQIKEKQNLEIVFQDKFKNLENLKRNESEALVHCKETLLYYKQQIDDYEQKIKRYERERKSFLEDFEFPKPSETSSSKTAWADNTLNINTNERSPETPNSKAQEKTQLKSDEHETEIFQCSPFVRKSTLLNVKKKSQNFSKISKKQKPQLEFLTQDSSLMVKSENSSRKRRLFSTNLNHYIQ